MFLLGFEIYFVEFEVLLEVDADGADDSALDVREFVETNLFTYSFITLIELSEELPGQIESMLYVVV